MVHWSPIEWSSNSCTGNSKTGCIIQLVFDMDLPQDQRKGIFFRQLRKCPHHSNLDGDSLLTTIQEESNRKESVRHEILTTFSDLVGNIVDGILQWKNGIEMKWSYDDNRILTVSLTGIILNTQQKNTIQYFCDGRFGIGKVIIK